MKIRDEETPAEPPAIAWPAMSGAAVFAGEVLIGIVRIAGEESDRHQLRVLPIDRLFTREDAANTLVRLGYPMLPKVDLDQLITVPVKDSRHLVTSESQIENTDEHIFPEKFVLKFYREISLRAGPIVPILEAYYPDLLEDKMVGFKFQPKHLSFEYSGEYLALRESINGVSHIKTRRLIAQLEKMLSQALLMTFNIAYLREKQNHFCFQSCFWISRAIRASVVGALQYGGIEISSLGELQDDAEDKIVLPPDPLNYFVWNRCYQSNMIKIDLWIPSDGAKSTSAYVPERGEIGSWFSKHPVPTQPLRDFWNPNDLYNFIFPQMLLRHLISGEPLIENWEGFRVGAA